MSAELVVRTEIPPISWGEFIATHPVGSIALDGYVGEGPNFDPNGPYLNANHHEGVKRLETLSTAQQILMDIRMGMDAAFRKDGDFSPIVFVNDCDQDVCTAWFLLNHVEEAKAVTNPQVNRFVNVAGTLDATAGAFPYDRDLKILGQLRWVFQPYSIFRASGEMTNKDNVQYRSVIDDVDSRIRAHLMGEGRSLDLDPRYKVISDGQSWKMIEEIGKDGRVGALVDGIDAYVAVQKVDDNRWRYTVGRRSEFIPFDVPSILGKLNAAEGCTDDMWGGATIIGGSPRVGASKLSPTQVQEIINQYLEQSQN